MPLRKKKEKSQQASGRVLYNAKLSIREAQQVPIDLARILPAEELKLLETMSGIANTSPSNALYSKSN